MSAAAVALELAGRGWPVFPCNAAKEPTTDHGHLDASCNREEVKRLFAQRPGPMVGIATGGAGLVVVDVDVKGGVDGYESLHELSASLGVDLTDTMMVDTPSGGQHLYFRTGDYHVQCIPQTKFIPGIDVKAEGGYVIAAGSRNGQGGYITVEGHGPERLAELPAPLAARIAYRASSAKRPEAHEGAIPEGSRNDHLTRLAGSMRRPGMTQEAMEAALQVENAKRCQPPLPDCDVARIAASVARYAPNPGAALGPDDAAAPEGFELMPLDWQTLLREGVPEIEYISEPYLPKLARIWVWGQTGSMKSLWCLHEAARLSREGVRVSYFSEENPIGEELRRLSKMAPSPDYFRMFHRTGMDLADDKWIVALLAATKGDDVAILDSWTDLWSGDEDSNRDMQKFDAGVLKPLQAQGVTPVVIHHMGHQQMFSDRGGATAGRGASSLGQKADVTLTFKSAGDDRFTIVYGKSRIGGTHHPPCSFKVEDSDDGTVTIVETVSPEDRAVAELAEKAAQAILTAPRGYLTTTELRVVIGGSKSHQTAALALLGVDSRVHAGVEKVQTRDGKFRDSKVWRPAGGVLGDGFDFAADGGVNASTHPPIGVGDGFMGSILMPSNPSAKSEDGLGSTSTDRSTP